MVNFLQKIIIIFICFPLVGIGPKITGFISVPSGGGAADDCSGNLIYSHHMENNDDPTIGTPLGCSDNATYKNLNKGNDSSYSTTVKYDGDYSLYQNGASGYAWLPTDSAWLDGLKETGCWRAWVKIDGANNSYLFELEDTDGDITRARWYNSSTKIRVDTQSGGYVDFTDDIAAAGSIVTICWDYSQTGGSDKVKVKIDGNAWQEDATLTETTLATLVANLEIIGRAGYESHAYVDALELADTYAYFD